VNHFTVRNFLGKLARVAVLATFGAAANAADHLDLPRTASGAELARADVSITDFYAFVSSNKFVMVMNVSPFLDPQVTSFRFPTDVSYKFSIDQNSAVTMGNDVSTREFGGVINNPARISEDVVFEVKFDARNNPRLNVTGSDRAYCDGIRSNVRLFTGLRAETFIFAPLVRNNVGSIVLEVPLSQVVRRQSKLLAWASTTVTTPAGVFSEFAGRALRSQFAPSLLVNALHPSEHVAAGLPRPDVLIIDVNKPTAFPNGRALSDDVIDIVGAFTSLPSDPGNPAAEIALCAPNGASFPCPVAVSATADDVRILGRFPYLGRPYTLEERTSLMSGNLD
jgi:hypothetical protein